MNIDYRRDLNDVDWTTIKAALAADDFDNGRSPEQLRLSFENSQAVVFAWLGAEVVGTARVLSDAVCNAYLVDVWTNSRLRRQGIAREMIQRLMNGLSGQHVYLQADNHLLDFWHHVGFNEQPMGMSRIVGKWLGESSFESHRANGRLSQDDGQ
jgi:GNAT superfamily N-acetyltransferase